MDLVFIAIVLGLLAVVYGFVTSRQVLSSGAGNEKMQEIAAAIQEGAQAYLKRQYTTIAIVGVVVAVLVFIFLGIILLLVRGPIRHLTGRIGNSPSHWMDRESIGTF